MSYFYASLSPNTITVTGLVAVAIPENDQAKDPSLNT
jgi:hypothetical protein